MHLLLADGDLSFFCVALLEQLVWAHDFFEALKHLTLCSYSLFMVNQLRRFTLLNQIPREQQGTLILQSQLIESLFQLRDTDVLFCVIRLEKQFGEDRLRQLFFEEY